MEYFFAQVIEHFTPHSTIQIIGTCFGLATLVVSFINYIFTDRNKILVVKFINDVLSISNSLCYAQYVNMGMNVVALFREAVFFNRGKKKWADSRVWLFVFMALMGATPFVITLIMKGGFDSSSWIEILPGIGSMIVVYGLYSENTMTTKICVLTGQCFYVAYQAIWGNVGAFLSSTAPAISSVIGIINEFRKIKKEKAQAEERPAEEKA